MRDPWLVDRLLGYAAVALLIACLIWIFLYPFARTGTWIFAE